MYDARTIGVNTIIAPMIETAYAMKKYVMATKFVFPDEERKEIKFLINTETITGFNNIDDMIRSEYFKDINHVFIYHGRAVCTARLPKCENCVINKFCEYENMKKRNIYN